MKLDFESVMRLQRKWSSANTPEMQTRGVLVRATIPNQLRRDQRRLASAAEISDLAIEGRDGTGRKTPIPWVRFYSQSRSPSAQDGWYCVYLFHPDGTGVYLTLIHGATTLKAGSFVAREPNEMAQAVSWAREVAKEELQTDPRIVTSIDLGESTSKLDRAYEASTAFAIWYSLADLPGTDQLLTDAEYFAGILGRIYRAQQLVPETGTPLDLIDAERSIETVTKPAKAYARGQGRGLSGPERVAVEKAAMLFVEEALSAEGFTVRDVSASASFDFEASKDGATYYVEVKGTTGGLGSIILTSNEVDLHLREYPNNFLFVVHSIKLDRMNGEPTASGGVLVRFAPWRIEQDRLKPIAYSYALE